MAALASWWQRESYSLWARLSAQQWCSRNYLIRIEPPILANNHNNNNDNNNRCLSLIPLLKWLHIRALFQNLMEKVNFYWIVLIDLISWLALLAAVAFALASTIVWSFYCNGDDNRCLLVDAMDFFNFQFQDSQKINSFEKERTGKPVIVLLNKLVLYDTCACATKQIWTSNAAFDSLCCCWAKDYQ